MLRILFVCLLGLTLLPAKVQAQEGLEVLSLSQENHFPEEIVFRLEAKAPSRIEKITLFYEVVGSKSWVYAYPEFTPGSHVKAEYTLKNNTQKTYLPPQSRLTYYWVLEDASRKRWETARTSFAFEDIRFSWRQLSQGVVTLYWYQGSEAFAQDLLSHAVATIDRLAALMGTKYDNPTKILVYSTKRDMDPALPKRSEVFSQHTVTLGMRLTEEILVMLGNQPETKPTLAHELSHIVLKKVVEGPFGHLPAWLDEGLAMNAEESPPIRYQFTLAEAARRDSLISIRSLSAPTGDPSQVDLFYAQAYSVVRFLLDRYGEEKMRELLRLFKEGSRYDEALEKVYGFNMEGLDSLWRQSLGLPPRPTPTPAPARVVPSPTAPVQSSGRTTTPPLLLMLGGAALAVAVAAVVGLFLLYRRSG